MAQVLRITSTPTEGIVKSSSNTGAIIGTTSLGTGSIYVTQEILTWKLDGENRGFSIPYRRITCHAISRDGSMQPAPCLYVMVNGSLEDESESIEDIDGDDDLIDDDDEMTEVFFIPPDAPTLDLLYKAIEECSLLHPDPCSDMSDESDINEGFVPQGALDDDDDDEEDEEEDIDNLPPAQQLANLQAYLAARLQIGQAGAGGGDAVDNNAAAAAGILQNIPPPSNGHGHGHLRREGRGHGRHIGDMSDDDNDEEIIGGGNPPQI